jgi:hypothetical protein
LIEQALSDLFHEELDHEDVSGPFQRLQLELESPRAARRRRGRRIFMTRNRLVLLAAALVLVLGVTVFVSARLFNANRVGQTINAGPDKTKVAQLLARPLKFQYPQPGLEACPADGPFTDGFLGGGPVFGSTGSRGLTITNWGSYGYPLLLTSEAEKGPIVMRALNLRTGVMAAFLDPHAGGPVTGTDIVNGKTVNQYGAVVLDTDHSPAATIEFRGSKWVAWEITHGWPKFSTGFCSGMQIDGPDFTEIIYGTMTP